MSLPLDPFLTVRAAVPLLGNPVLLGRAGLPYLGDCVLMVRAVVPYRFPVPTVKAGVH
jgi:hypothetical protein